MTRSSNRVLLTLAMLGAVLLGASMTPPRAEGQSRTRPKAGKTPKGEAVYSCAMHPEVKAKQAGRCPKCGMDLQHVKPAAQSTPATPASEPGGAKVALPVESKLAIPDVELLDQDGRRTLFYSDLVRGRVVAINFIFTTCTTICPPLGATFARVQKELGERAGRDVSFISISVDPVTDTPERLKAWGGKFKAGPAWSFVTGEKPQVNELLRTLGALPGSPQDHSPTMLIVNDARGQWTRTYGLAPPSRLVKLINDAIEGNLETKEAAKQ